MPGYPDFQAYAQWRTGNVAPSLNATYTHGTSYLPIQSVQSWSAVMLRIVASSGYGTVSVNWWIDSAQTESVGSDSWEIGTVSGLLVIIPVKANFFQIEYTVGPAITLVVTNYVCGINNAISEVSYPVASQHISDTGRTLAASTSYSYSPAFIKSGEWGLYYKPYDSSGKMSVSVKSVHGDSTLNYVVIDDLFPTAEYYNRIVVPGTPIQVTVSNDDSTASHEYDISFVSP